MQGDAFRAAAPTPAALHARQAGMERSASSPPTVPTTTDTISTAIATLGQQMRAAGGDEPMPSFGEFTTKTADESSKSLLQCTEYTSHDDDCSSIWIDCSYWNI